MAGLVNRVMQVAEFRKARAFRTVFDVTGPNGAEVERVLATLRDFCFATKSTALGAVEDLPVLEGRRQVWLKICEYLHMDEKTVRELKTVHQQYFGGIEDDD